jgi:hypothetical protein
LDQKTTTHTETKTQTPTNTNHDYIKYLPTFAERGKAIAGRVEEIQGNPKYQALSEDKKTQVRANLYKQLVPQSYLGFHLPVPDEKTWVAATAHPLAMMGKPISETYGMQGTTKEDGWNSRRNKETGQDLAIGVSKFEQNISLFGAKVANKTFMEMQNVAQHFSHYDSKGVQTPVLGYSQSETKRLLDNFADAKRARLNSLNYYQDIHPRDTVLGRLDVATGEQLAMLPLYEAVEAGAVKVGARAIVGAGTALGEQSLTKVLTNSKLGGWVAKRLVDSATGLIATTAVTGGDKRAGVAGGVIGAVAGPVLEGYTSAASGIIKYASGPLLEKFIANTIAMAGKPFAEELAKSAFAEMQPAEWWLEHGTQAGIKEYRNASMLGRDLAIFPETETKGKFVNTRTNQTYHYDGKQEQQLIFDHLHKDNLQVRETEDPVMAKLHEGEKVAWDSISYAKFQKPLSALGKEEKDTVMVARMKQISEAAKKAPALLPDLQHLEVQQNLARQSKVNPKFGALMDRLNKINGKTKVADTVTSNIIEDVKKQTGITNADGAVRKVKKAVKETLSASLGMPSDTAAFRNQSRLTLQRDLGEKAKSNWGAFYEQLKKAAKVGVRFETPEQRMLYMYGNRKTLPQELQEKLVGRIRQMRGYGVKEISIPDLQEKADWLHVHLLEMAHSGHFDPSEPGVFASTKSGSPIDGTKYQMQMKIEADQAQIKAVTKALANDPQAQKTFKAAFIGLQKASEKMWQSPETWLQYRNDLADLADEHLKRKINRVGHTF